MCVCVVHVNVGGWVSEKVSKLLSERVDEQGGGN